MTSSDSNACTNAMVTDDGAQLFFQDRGSGEPLVLLHGLSRTGKDWEQVLDRAQLVAYRVITLDARGHGRSTNPSGVSTIRRYALDVLGLLDQLALPCCRAIGMSLGAKTLLHVATLAPERVSKLVLVSATPRFPDETRCLMRRWATFERSPEEWEEMRQMHAYGDAQIERLWRVAADLADDPSDMNFSQEDLHVITAQALIVAGDRDPLYPIELAVELYRGIRNSALYVVPNAGHSPIFGSERANFVERALAFLAGP